MKNLLLTSLIAITMTLPVASFAQSASGPLTRAEARAQSAHAAQDHRAQSKVYYPTAKQDPNQNESGDTGGYGSQTGGSSEWRMPSAPNAGSSNAFGGVFAHH